MKGLRRKISNHHKNNNSKNKNNNLRFVRHLISVIHTTMTASRAQLPPTPSQPSYSRVPFQSRTLIFLSDSPTPRVLMLRGYFFSYILHFQGIVSQRSYSSVNSKTFPWGNLRERLAVLTVARHQKKELLYNGQSTIICIYLKFVFTQFIHAPVCEVTQSVLP